MPLYTRSFPDISIGKKIHLQCRRPRFDSWLGRSAGEGIGYPLQYNWASLVAQLVKNPPAMQEMWVRSLSWEDTLEKDKGYPFQYSGLENSMDYMMSQRLRTCMSDFHFLSLSYICHFSSVTQSCPTLCDPMDCSTPGLPVHHNSQSLYKLMSIEWVMPSNHLFLCHPLLLPSIFPRIRVFPVSQYFISSGQNIDI